jgi:hypothetical protein
MGREILLPSEASAIAAMKALAKGIRINSRFVQQDGKYQYIYEVEEDFELEMEIKILPPSAQIVDTRRGKKQLRLNPAHHTPTASEELGI